MRGLSLRGRRGQTRSGAGAASGGAPVSGDDGQRRGRQGEATAGPGRPERAAGRDPRRPQGSDTPTAAAPLTCSSSGVSCGAMSAWGAVAGSIPPPPPANRTRRSAGAPLWPRLPRARAQQPGAGSRMVGRRARARGAHGRRRWCLTRRRAELSPSSGRKSWFVFSAPFLTLPLLSRKRKSAGGSSGTREGKRKWEIKNFPGPERRLPACSAALPPLRRARTARPPLSAQPQASEPEGGGGRGQDRAPPPGSRPALQPPEPPAAPLRN